MSSAKRWRPRKYQQECVDAGIKKRFLALFLDPGLGKTSILLQIFNKLKIRGKVNAALVIAPLNPCYMTWPLEIKDWSNFKRFKCAILHGPRKVEALKSGADIYIINPEGLKWLAQMLKGKRKKSWPFDMLIVDESGKFKHPTSARSKQLHRMSPAFTHRYIANGTPTGNGYEGLMSQMQIVDQGESLGTKITYYRQKYFKQVGRPEWRQFELQEGAEQRIIKKIAKYALCMRAEDHVSMPSLVYKPIYVSLPAKAMKVYREIEDELFSEVDDNELIAESAASMSIKLHQICNGTIYADPDPLAPKKSLTKTEVIHLHSEKLFAIEDIIDELAGKQLLIGYHFRHDKQALKAYFKNDITFFDEAKTKEAKIKLQADWNKGKIKLLAGNPASIGHGLNLQKGHACHIALYSIYHDFENLDQFIRRLRRSGNDSAHVTVMPILAKGLYDHEVIYPNVIKKGNTQDRFFVMLKRYIAKRKTARLTKK